MQTPSSDVLFGPFRLDRANECLWRDDERIALRPRSYALLDYLVRNPGRLLSKAELLDHIWRDTVVGDSVLKVGVRELRALLGDDMRNPTYIETLHRRGYRFVAQPHASVEPARADPVRDGPEKLPDSEPTHVFGRERELQVLERALTGVERGERRVVFVRGESGLGKTALVRAFVEQATATLAEGQCRESFGTSEAYQPLLEALGRLGRGSSGAEFVAILRSRAPTWFVQMPWLVEAADRVQLEREILGATQQRMLRELGEALESFCRERTLLLTIEDLHWSDYATLDALDYVARRHEAARLLIVATYRPVEVILNEHPLGRLARSLVVDGAAVDLPLELLDRVAIGAWLDTVLEGPVEDELTSWLHDVTEGNPMFVARLFGSLRERELIQLEGGRWTCDYERAARETPASLRPVIEAQIERRSPREQRVLTAASLVGVEFSAAAVAPALGEELAVCEATLEGLAGDGQFLIAEGLRELPDGTCSARFRFVHALVREILLRRMPAGQRARAHLAIAARGVEAFGSQVAEISSELAFQFEGAERWEDAIRHHQTAADRSFVRHANREARATFERALELSERLDPERQRLLRGELLESLGTVRRALGDMEGAAECFREQAALAAQSERPDDEARAWLLAASAMSWVGIEACLQSVDEARAAAERCSDELVVAHVHGYAAYWNLLCRGWRDEDAESSRAAIERFRAAGDEDLLAEHLPRHSWFASMQSRYDEAAELAHEGRELAREQSDAFDALIATFFRGWALLLAGRWRELRGELAAGARLTERNGDELWGLLYGLLESWLHIEAGPSEATLERLRAQLARAEESEHHFGRLLASVLCGLAEEALGQHERAIAALLAARDLAAREGTLMGWSVVLPLQAGLARAFRMRAEPSDTAEAEREATLLLEQAVRSGERTFLTLAHTELAYAQVARRRWRQAQDEIDRGRRVLADEPAGLAAWRLEAAAVVVARGRRKSDEARAADQASARLRQALLDQLEG